MSRSFETALRSQLEYFGLCEELWQKGIYIELHAYQHHVFMDWRFVDDEKWHNIYVALNGAGVESMSARWDEMFGIKDEEVKVKKIAKTKKQLSVTKKPAKKKPAPKESVNTIVNKSPAKKSTRKTQ